MASPDILAKNLLIEASAGSGKTYQLGNRAIARIAEGAAPERVAALTFTRKAAGEFTDSVLKKLADAAEKPDEAAKLDAAIRRSETGYADLLESVVRALPRMTFGTIDGFFSRIIRSFQYELGLTGGRFSLLEGPHAENALDDLLAGIFGDTLSDAETEEFLRAHRRANIGKETNRVSEGIRRYIRDWYGIYRSKPHFEWAPDSLPHLSVEDWEENRAAWAAEALEKWEALDYQDSRLNTAVAKDLKAVGEHAVGSGSLGSLSTLGERIRSSAALGETGSMGISYYKKEYSIPAETAACFRLLFRRAAEAETGTALIRTRAIRALLDHYDARRETQFRRRGRLSFDDVKRIMGAWAGDEDARVRRELVDFRLDEKTDHWLLDEFQDTSRADWAGLSPLVTEAFTRPDASVFIVGDRKQAIYGWRGGDVGLFDDIIGTYSDASPDNPDRLRVKPMAESHRSSPEVLELVNKVCGDVSAIRSIYGAAVADRWKWDEHRAAARLCGSDNRGQSRVIPTAGREDRLAKLTSLLREHGAGEKKFSCGVLLRSNNQVKEYAGHLRAEGFDVIEEGTRRPAKDSASGVLLHQLARWLADPSDALARGAISLSPLADLFEESAGDQRLAWWRLTEEISRTGYAPCFSRVFDLRADCYSDYEKRRARDVFDALAACDAEGITSAAVIANHLERLEVPQSPGSAAVQVMTIHKSKGLGFDMVVVPEIAKGAVPDAGDYKCAVTGQWVLDPPPAWARAFVPELASAEETWAEEQRYEDLCVLYVALTRAKRGLYVFFPELAAKHDATKTSPANLLLATLGGLLGDDDLFTCGEPPEWPEREKKYDSSELGDRELPMAAALPARMKPSSVGHAPASFLDGGGMAFGAEVHSLCEHIGWVDEDAPIRARGPAGDAVAAMLAEPSLFPCFHRADRNITLLREQPIDALLDGRLLSGIIDRLHLHNGPDGQVTRIEIIDYKTDAVKSPDELLERHRPQLDAYRAALALIHPGVPVDCVLISVRNKAAVVF